MLTVLNSFGVDNVQIEKSSTATTYMPYHETSYLIPQSVLNLPGYGWSARDVYNEVDWENKQYIQRVEAVNLGSLEWETNGADENTYRFKCYIPEMKSNSICICVFSKAVRNGVSNDEECIGNIDGYLYLRLSTTKISYSVESLLAYLESVNCLIYYELAKPIVTDISDFIGDAFQEPFEVEAGGTLTFKNSNSDDYRIPVPSTEEYLISLVEVNGND